MTTRSGLAQTIGRPRARAALQHRLVILDPVVPSRRAGIEDELGVLGGLDELEVEPLADLEIALGADVQALPPERGIERIVAPIEMLPRLFARRHDVMIEALRARRSCAIRRTTSSARRGALDSRTIRLPLADQFVAGIRAPRASAPPRHE